MGSRNGPLIFLIAILFGIATLTSLLGFHHVQDRRFLQNRQDARNCTTDLAKDLYGLGVRLGVYFQWFSGWVSNNFVVDELSGGLDANSIFLFALLIAMVSSTKTNDMSLMDGLVMLSLCAGTIWSVLSLWGYRTCVYRKEGLNRIRRLGGFGTHLRLLLAAGVSWYAIWYWTVGVKGLPKGLPDFGDVPSTCDKRDVSIFGNSVTGIARHVALSICLVAGAYSVLVTLAAPIAAVTRIRKMVHFLRCKRYASTTRLRFATGASAQQLKVAGWVLCWINLAWIVFTMSMIEVVLNENYAFGVLCGKSNDQNGQILQPAQLIPMLIGTFSFIRILYITFELWRSPEGDINPSLGRGASRRLEKAKRRSAQGLHIFQLFSQSAAEVEHLEEDQQRKYSIRDDSHDGAYLDLHLRLNAWQRILITWLPWVSLFWFFPWSKDISEPVSQSEDLKYLKPRNEPISLRTPHRKRFTDWDDEEDSVYHRPASQSSVTREQEPQISQGML